MNSSEKIARRGRGRPPGFDRLAALDAAVPVFWARGYEGASVDDLTAAMGLNRSSLYQAFGDKRALFFEALDRYGETVGSAPLAALRSAPGPFAEAARAFVMAAINSQTDPSHPLGCLVTCVLADSAGLDSECRDRLASILRATDDALTARATSARDAGELPTSSDPRRIAFMLSSLMHSLSLRARAGEKPDALRRDAAAILGGMF